MLSAIVTESVQQASAADEIEWAQLEANRPSDWEITHTDQRPKFIDAPHPLSYGAHLPLRAAPLDRHGHPRVSLTLTAAEKQSIALRTAGVAAKSVKTIVRPNAAHPDSYRPDLPLRGLAIERRNKMPAWPLTAAEKATLADRPLRYSR